MLKQFGKLDPLSLEIAKALMSYSWRQKQEELRAEQNVLIGCRENIRTLRGANLPLWNQAFDNRITQVQNDIEEVNKAFSDLTKNSI